ncbi:DUF1684 domain-containing protein [Hymenobacter persicinus]|uniref:DUF1684 domain-containing protein n=1 Tax=Hymenobacter persicinus TaxID=2025506 RepID=A0A4Q5LC58_9BACT|nr:DUF1684 domain-containing protein [Hymenobacter persicinus]RYU78957.1 DUF1684 domain-containing protein [Hymenobacter persicinus]
MKLRYYYFLTLSLLAAAVSSGSAQTSVRLAPAAHAESVAAFQRELNAEYRDPAQSPLPAEVRATFTALPFFPADYRYYVEATFVRDSTSAPFKMKTTGLREPEYRKYGELRFVLEGRPLVLPVYQSLDLMHKAGYEDYLFVPFTDLTNGHETYGGGRYLDFRIPKARLVPLDFNRAYNPYCAYATGKYSCPVVPAENRLPVAIRAGVRSDH